MSNNIAIASVVLSLSLLGVAGCAEEGESGSTTVDCGGHGSEHDGHCHCDPGYLFAEETCVDPKAITAICEEHQEHSEDVIDADADVTAAEEEHHHDACLCPATGECHCENGTVESFGTERFCVPELHEDE